MRDPDGSDLDALLSSAAPVRRDAAEEERLFADVWSRVHPSMTDGGAGTPGDTAQERRLTLIGDREVSARRRRRAARLASTALAVAVAGGGTSSALASARDPLQVPRRDG